MSDELVKRTAIFASYLKRVRASKWQDPTAIFHAISFLFNNELNRTFSAEEPASFSSGLEGKLEVTSKNLMKMMGLRTVGKEAYAPGGNPTKKEHEKTADFNEFFFGLSKEEQMDVLRSMVTNQFLLSSAIETAIVSFKRSSAAKIEPEEGSRIRVNPGQRIILGLSGMNTEIFSTSFIKKYSEFLKFLVDIAQKDNELGNVLEVDKLAKSIADKEMELFEAALKDSTKEEFEKFRKENPNIDFDQAKFTEKDFKILSNIMHHSGIIYEAFEQINSDRKKILGMPNDKGWLSLFTWYGGDSDGSEVTAARTKVVIESIESEIKRLYLKDIDKLIVRYADNEELYESLEAIAERFRNNEYKSAVDFQTDLNNLQEIFPETKNDIKPILDKTDEFGFHFLKIEYRENSQTINKVLNAIIELYDPKGEKLSPILENIFGDKYKGKKFSELDERGKFKLLETLNTPRHQDLLNDIFKNAESNLSSIEDAKTMQTVSRIISRAKLAEQFKDNILVNAIAETKEASDVLALMTILRASGKKNMRIAVQPEAAKDWSRIEEILTPFLDSPVYKVHLSETGNRQLLVVGFSDITKRDGIAGQEEMLHAVRTFVGLCNKKGITARTHIINGHESGRGGGHIIDLIERLMVSIDQFKYSAAGTRELRSAFSIPEIAAINIEAFFRTSTTEVSEVSEDLKSIEKLVGNMVYRHNKFFKDGDNPNITALIEATIPFEYLKKAASDPRPIARSDEYPKLYDSIRAMPWFRAFMMAGIHPEIVGVGALREEKATDLHALYGKWKDSISHPFTKFIKSVAYSIAKVDFDHAWEMIGHHKQPTDSTKQKLADYIEKDNLPEGEDKAVALLCWLEQETNRAKEVVYAAINGRYKSASQISTEDILAPWPIMNEEIKKREQLAKPMRKMLIHVSEKHKEVDPEVLSAIFALSMESLNMEVSAKYGKSQMPPVSVYSASRNGMVVGY